MNSQAHTVPAESQTGDDSTSYLSCATSLCLHLDTFMCDNTTVAQDALLLSNTHQVTRQPVP